MNYRSEVTCKTKFQKYDLGHARVKFRDTYQAGRRKIQCNIVCLRNFNVKMDKLLNWVKDLDYVFGGGGPS